MIYRGRRNVDNNNFGKGNYMQVSGINSYSAPKVSFGTDSVEDKKINKKAAIAAGVGVAAAAVGTTAYALKRGKLVTDDGAKFFTKLKEGFKTFVGENRLTFLKAKAENLQDIITNGRKVTENGKEVRKALEEADATKLTERLKNINEKINKLGEKLAQKAQKAADKTAEAAQNA